jgi:hypothetical protein
VREWLEPPHALITPPRSAAARARPRGGSPRPGRGRAGA